jgi:RNA polymerase sigma-70 factor (ECF subfamily)
MEVMAERGEKPPASPANDDSEGHTLVARFNQGDDSAFDKIVEKHLAQVTTLANRLLGWPSDVDDLAQDVFLAAFIGLRRFRGGCSFRTWLFTITINKCRTYRYRRLLRGKFFSKTEKPVSNKSAPAADKALMDTETFERVSRAMAALPDRYREPLVLRYLQELSTCEIARILGVSENTVQVRLTRARRRLKDDLKLVLEE